MQEDQPGSAQKPGKRKRGGGGSGSTIDALADAAARKLSSAEPRLQLAGQELQFVAQRELVMSPAVSHAVPLRSLSCHTFMC